MHIKGIHKTSLIDYPGKICSILFTGGCNLRCRYCQNQELVYNSDDIQTYNIEDILRLLKKRKGLIDGVVISGGEPTISNDLNNFIKAIKNIPLLVKLDTNGLNPIAIKSLITNNLIDYLAIDIKTSPEKYEQLSQKKVDFLEIMKTIEIVKESTIEFELRTTCIPYFVTIEDLQSIKRHIGFIKKYYLHQFINKKTLDPSLQEYKPYPLSTLYHFKDFIKTFADICEIRGI